jgi:hypothetical protein
MRHIVVLVPFAAVLAVVFGGYYAVAGIRLVMAGSTVLGGVFLGYGAGGVLLGVALWKAYRDYKRKVKEMDRENADPSLRSG